MRARLTQDFGGVSGFGMLIRGRRKALKMRQDQLALATGLAAGFSST